MEQTRWRRMGSAIPIAVLIACSGCMGSVDDYHESLASEGESQIVQLDAPDDGVDKALRRDNGLRTVNGLSRESGTLMARGLSTAALDRNTTYSSMARSSAGKDTVRYLVQCALPPGDSISIGPDRYNGNVGLAPEWKRSSCDTSCQEKVTACLLALTNGPGNSVEVELAGGAPLGYSHTFSGYEATFFGNIFQASPKAYFCFGSSLYTTRMCQSYEANTPNSCPYFEAQGLFCDNYGPNNSKKGACGGQSSGTPSQCTGADGRQYGHPITVYRSGGTRNQALSTARLSGQPLGGAAGQWWRLGL